MECTFYRPATVNLREYKNIIGKLEYDLKTLTMAKTKDLDIYYYVMNLCREAKALENNSEMCFWGMDNPKKMPSDARVAYFYRPTYLATAFLMQALLKYPELENEHDVNWESGKECVRMLKEVLPKAMKACTGRGFAGHGFDGLSGQLETMELFLSAKANDFIVKYPDMCPDFSKLFTHTLDSYRKKVKEGKTFGAWGEDYSEKMKQMLSYV